MRTQRLEIDGSKPFPTGRGFTVWVTRTAAATYRVVVTDLSGHAVPCYSTEFTPERIPADMSPRRAAWEYVLLLVADFGGDLETPAAVAARMPRPIAA